MFSICECPAEIDEFTAGSVVVTFTLSVVVNTDVTTLLETLQQAASNSTLLPGYVVAADSLTLTEGRQMTSCDDMLFCLTLMH